MPLFLLQNSHFLSPSISTYWAHIQLFTNKRVLNLPTIWHDTSGKWSYCIIQQRDVGVCHHIHHDSSYCCGQCHGAPLPSTGGIHQWSALSIRGVCYPETRKVTTKKLSILSATKVSSLHNGQLWKSSSLATLQDLDQAPSPLRFRAKHLLRNGRGYEYSLHLKTYRIIKKHFVLLFLIILIIIIFLTVYMSTVKAFCSFPFRRLPDMAW